MRLSTNSLRDVRPISSAWMISSANSGGALTPEQILMRQSRFLKGFPQFDMTSIARSTLSWLKSFLDFPRSLGFTDFFWNLRSLFKFEIHFETLWLVNTQRWTVPTVVLYPLIPPWHFCSRFIVCSMAWSDGMRLNSPSVRLTVKFPALWNIFQDFLFERTKLQTMVYRHDISWEIKLIENCSNSWLKLRV